MQSYIIKVDHLPVYYPCYYSNQVVVVRKIQFKSFNYEKNEYRYKFHVCHGRACARQS